ncbi:MAG: peptidase [Spirochaetia bacterium]|jgi:tripeptide aminopeptidase|nr:peptidase [Spirochaetia bacterium]
MKDKISDILESIPKMEENLREIRDVLLTNLVMLGEIPSLTFSEQARMNFLVNRFNQSNLLNCSTDEVGNGLGILPGKIGDRNILLVAHLDTEYDEKMDHTIAILPNSVSGAGVADNALGLAVLASLPYILEKLEIELNSSLILMGSARSLGAGNLEGIRFFLENTNLNISTGLSVEGVRLGRISRSSVGMAKCEVHYWVPEGYDWTQFGAFGSIVTLNEFINRILEIPIPTRPATSIVFSSIESGRGFSKVSTEAELKFEIQSESEEMVEQLLNKINNIAVEIAAKTSSKVMVKELARRKPGGIDFSHPLVLNTMKIMETMKIKPRFTPSMSELSAFIDAGIPALTVGISNLETANKVVETVEIEPMYKGLAQLISLLLAIDRGVCDEN